MLRKQKGGMAFAVPLTSRLASTPCDLLASAAKAVEGRSCLGMAEAVPFPTFHRNQNSKFLGRAKYALGRNDKLNVWLQQCLATAAGAAAAHAAVAAAVSGHDAAAEAAGWGVAQVDDARQGVGGMNRAGAGSQVSVLSSQLRRRNPGFAGY